MFQKSAEQSSYKPIFILREIPPVQNEMKIDPHDAAVLAIPSIRVPATNISPGKQKLNFSEFEISLPRIPGTKKPAVQSRLNVLTGADDEIIFLNYQTIMATHVRCNA